MFAFRDTRSARAAIHQRQVQSKYTTDYLFGRALILVLAPDGIARTIFAGARILFKALLEMTHCNKV